VARAQTAAQDLSAESLRRIADGLDAWNAREEARAHPLPAFRRPDRTYDALGRQTPRNPFSGTLGVATLLRMGLAREFATVVPAEYRLGPWVLCTCGELSVLERPGVIAECPGLCGRFFLRAETSVRVARWAREDNDESVVA
jgi:hypothetical protein